MHRKCLLYSQFVYEINLAMCRQYDWLSAKMLQVDLCYSSRFTLAHQQSDAVWTTPPLKIACPAHHSTMHQTLLRIWASSWGILGWPCIVYILLYNMMSFATRVQQLLRIVCHKFERIGRWEGGAGEGRGKSILQIACRCWGWLPLRAILLIGSVQFLSHPLLFQSYYDLLFDNYNLE